MINELEFSQAYQTGFPTTVRFLLSKGIRIDTAEELAQAAWSRGWERLDQLREQNRLKTWINTIALNFYRRGLRDNRRREPLSDIYGRVSVDVAAIDLTQVLKRCPEADQKLLKQHLTGLTTAELALVVGCTESAARVRLCRARKSARIACQELGSRAAAA